VRTLRTPRTTPRGAGLETAAEIHARITVQCACQRPLLHRAARRAAP